MRSLKTIALVILIFCIAACSSEAQSPDTNHIIISKIPSTARPTLNPLFEDDPVLLKILTGNIVLGLDYQEYFTDYYEIIKNKFNIDLQVNSPGMFGSYYEDAVMNDIFYFNMSLHIERKYMFDENYIIPFNDYVAESKTWAALPEEFRQAHMDAKGRIWAIPYNDTPLIWARTIQSEWLKNTELEVPSTVDELYGLMQAFTYQDPDNNDKNDTFGAGLSDKLLRLYNFKDIFEANGCILSYQTYWTNEVGWVTNQMIAGYNPKTGMIEDQLKNPGFMKSLEIIEAMLDNKLILREADMLVDGLFTNPKVGTHMGILNDNIIYPEKYDYYYSLEGTDDDAKATALIGNNEVFYLNSRAENPKKTVTAFLEMMFGSKENYELFHYGLLGEDKLYSKTNEIILKNDVNEKLATHLELIGDISWFKSNVQSEYELPAGGRFLNTEDIKKENDILFLPHTYMSILEYSTEVINMSPDGSYPTNPQYYYRDLTDAILAFYRGDINARDLNEEFQKMHRLYDMEEWLADVNQRWLGVN